VRRKLEQCAERSVRGRSPGRVPVTARLQLLPAQLRGSTAAATARETKDRAAANFMVTVEDRLRCLRFGACNSRGDEQERLE
jgi:hypothetical protein